MEIRSGLLMELLLEGCQLLRAPAQLQPQQLHDRALPKLGNLYRDLYRDLG